VHEGQVVRGVNPSSLDRLLVRSWAVIRELDTLMKTDFPEIAQLSLEISALEANLDAIAGDARKSAPAPREGFAKLFVEGARTKLWLDEALPQFAGMGATVVRAKGLVATGRATLAQLQARIDALTERIDFLRGQLDPARLAEFTDLLARVDVLTKKLDETLAGAEALTALLDSGQGTLAAFAQDMEIADEVKVVTKMLKEQPWLLAHPEMGAGKGPGL
jgi:cell division protein FtsB